MTEAIATKPTEPGERLRGTDYTASDLLNIDEAALARRDLMIGMMQVLIQASMVGSPAPNTAAVWERISSPQVGDLVVEHSVRYSSNPENRMHGFGILLGHRNEYTDTPDGWATLLADGAVGPEDTRTVEHAWYVQYGPSADDVCRWTNCDFYALISERPRA